MRMINVVQKQRAASTRPGLIGLKPGLPKGWMGRLQLLLALSLSPVAWAAPADAVCAAPTTDAKPASLRLHVPSPTWRDQIIYFVVTDRFNDGDKANNDQGAGEYDPSDGRKYSGGDLRGLGQRLDYIKGLGVTTVWLTPPVANQWWHQARKYGGYHGYWATDFKQVDAHMGSLADYQQLSHDLHSAGMYLVQDIVVNHTADYMYYQGAWNPAHVEQNFQLLPGPLGELGPRQWPFSMNDARDPAQRHLDVYHWTPDITDYRNRQQVYNFQMAGLDDLNTENPLVRRALRDSYGYWIRTVGVDGFRVDTALYVPPAYFDDFMNARDANCPGMNQVARQTGRQGFLTFGEGFSIDKPFASTEAQHIETYVRQRHGPGLLTSMLNFPLYASLGDVFARGHPTAELAYRLQSMMQVHSHPYEMVNFLDNHDVDRFLSSAGLDELKQGLLLLMTVPGIPAIYYGTEQGFTESRASMFKGGWHSGGVDHFDTQRPLYRYIQTVTALRREHQLFSRGQPTQLQADADGPGVLAYRMSWRHDGRNQAALVALNTAGQALTVSKLATGAPPSGLWRATLQLNLAATDLVCDSRGAASLTLPAHAAAVWLLDGKDQSRRATRLHSLKVGAPAPFTTRYAWRLLAQTTQAGPLQNALHGRYVYPSDPSWNPRRTTDLQSVKVWASGSKLRVDFTPTELSQLWNPPNGFDHLALTLFLQMPGQAESSEVMPQQNANVPDGMRWNYRLRVHGWSNAWFSAKHASAQSEGTPLGRGAPLSVDPTRHTISLLIDSATLDQSGSWSGAKLYLNTWDYDMGYRSLTPEPTSGSFGGGDGKQDPLIMADIPVLTLR